MNKTILTIATTLCLALNSSNTNAQVSNKSEKARKELKEAHKDVHESNEGLNEAKHNVQKAKKDSTDDYTAFKKDAEQDIADNKKTIAELRAKKWNSTAQSKAKYDTKIATLERKNNQLQKDINTANHTNQSNWTSFKREFKHDMNELGNALKDIGKNNVK